LASIAKQPLTPFEQWRRRFVHTWRTFFAQGDLSTLLVTVALLMMPVFSLNAAGWPLDMRTLIPVVLLSITFGFLLSRSYYNELLALIMSGVYGISFVLLIGTINEPGGLAEGAFSLFSRLFRWIVDAATGGINQDDLVFTLLVSSLFWFLGYNLAWHVFRIDRVWRAILPPGLILITNSLYYTGEASLEGYLVAYVFLSLLLVVRSNLDAREWDWYVNGIRVPRRLRRQFFRMGAALALLALLLGWGVPTGDLQERLNRFQEFMQSEPLTQLSELWNRLFSTAETQGPTTADYYGGDSLQLGGAIRLGEQGVFLVSAPGGRRYYWRSRVFDYYNSGRWTSAADTRLTDPEIPLDIVHEGYVDGARVPVQQTFTMSLSASRIIYTAPQPLRVDLPTRTDLRYIEQQAMNVSVIRPMRVLYRGDEYTVTSLMTNATADQLRAAPTTYPTWVTDVYLGYAPLQFGQTIQLAREIVTEAGATTPYDQARAIESWLRANITYNESIPQPPTDRDPVEWVLFDIREGYCNYYASAMVVMLRSLGIPSRMAAGFAQGEWDTAENAYLVRERDAHTWVEVYFPGYGWVEFEPTAAQAPIDRGDESPQFQQPTQPPPQTSTPTATATFTPTPTAGAPTVPPQAESNLLPTVTPSFTPSPTATPVIVPTQPPPVRPQPRGILSYILPALGVALLGLLLVALLVAIGFFIYWWWEWRGMKGLSPVSRAYARLERYLPLVGIRVAPQQTPEERRARVVRDLPAAEPPVTAITRLYVSERYGPAQPAEGAVQSDVADRAWTDARGNILKRLARRFLPWARK
jgi:transglutaminase-like putative cysteine protease